MGGRRRFQRARSAPVIGMTHLKANLMPIYLKFEVSIILRFRLYQILEIPATEAGRDDYLHKSNHLPAQPSFSSPPRIVQLLREPLCCHTTTGTELCL
ncbi:Caffeic acid 3-O-methyltransferase [Olea europaea subsp. europaea]|uniref:Caffeic acid 3-O-methyltransferase n=1 Tax=Olea europaea subsp. europaea TaxID=158383 RepID=A0A8S0UWI8_OLEEU|nr:Caffeic acid 3-O-methyltransferase [Olea europaea subsp. europaea]